MRWPGKILYFGEHTVLRGSQALAGPLDRFGGQWRTGGTPAQQQRLPEWLGWLRVQQAAGALATDYRLDDFATDLATGLYFDSNIPVGYGAGSSGALCAAFYRRYARDPLPAKLPAQLARLKTIFAELESFFHGSSSGTDPLICYAQAGLLIRPGGHIERTTLPPLPDPQAFFLVDTGLTRSTGPLVEAFLARCAEESFRQNALRKLITVSDVALDTWLQGHFDDLFDTFHALSTLQRQHLDFLIPKAFFPLWDQLLSTSHTRLKLCGAGGGGFLLGYTQDKNALTTALHPSTFFVL